MRWPARRRPGRASSRWPPVAWPARRSWRDDHGRQGPFTMNITVIGTGYVGLVVGACLAETGNTVTCADVDADKIDGLRNNVLPIYEPGLDAYVERNQR